MLNPNIILHIIWSGTPAFVNITPNPYANTTSNTTNNWVKTPKVATIYFGDI
jgi:hypothetical protein